RQLIKFFCMENQFVSVFGRHIMHFSPAKGTYSCVFKGENADDMLSEILGDQQWDTRYYEARQCAYVVLYMEGWD
ncbi:15680_t:CDS:1, partial [Acaulospora morrowiae]